MLLRKSCRELGLVRNDYARGDAGRKIVEKIKRAVTLVML